MQIQYVVCGIIRSYSIYRSNNLIYRPEPIARGTTGRGAARAGRDRLAGCMIQYLYQYFFEIHNRILFKIKALRLTHNTHTTPLKRSKPARKHTHPPPHHTYQRTPHTK